MQVRAAFWVSWVVWVVAGSLAAALAILTCDARACRRGAAGGRHAALDQAEPAAADRAPGAEGPSGGAGEGGEAAERASPLAVFLSWWTAGGPEFAAGIEAKAAEESDGRIGFLAGTAMVFHLTFVTKLVLTSAWSGRLSPKTGLDWEGYAVVLTLLSLWVLGQAALVRAARPEARFGAAQIAQAVARTVLPLAADPVDTLKDALFAGVALCEADKVSQAIGLVSFCWLWGLHAFMIVNADLQNEMKNSYAAVLMMRPAPQGSLAACETLPLRQKLTNFVCCWKGTEGGEPTAKAWQKLAFSQTTPARQKAVLLEDGPQGCLAVLFLLCSSGGVSPLVLTLNVLVPAARLAAARHLFYYLLGRPGVQAWQAREGAEALDAGQKERAAVHAGHLAAASGWTIGGLSESTWAEVLASASFHEQVLKALRGGAGGRALGDAGSEAWAAALARNKTLRKLTLTSAGLGAGAGVALAHALDQNTALEVLVLDDNAGLGDAGAEALAAVLARSEILRALSLVFAGLGDGAGVALARALEQNTALTFVDLSSNKGLGDASAEALAAALACNTTLESLFIFGASFSPKGRAALEAVAALEGPQGEGRVEALKRRPEGRVSLTPRTLKDRGSKEGPAAEMAVLGFAKAADSRDTHQSGNA